MKKALLIVLMILLLASAACQPAPDVVATEEPDAGVVSLSPTAGTEEPILPLVWFIPNVDANCRIGPAIAYPYLAVLTPGAEYQVLGINEDASWLFINTNLTQCWVKLTTGEASNDPRVLPFVAYGPVPTPIQQVAGEGAGNPAGNSGSSSGGSGLTLMPIGPIVAVAILCGSYTTETDCTSHGCTWVPPKLVMCGTAPTQYVCGATTAYCTN